jgi:ATP-binding cassette subfamily F protein 3
MLPGQPFFHSNLMANYIHNRISYMEYIRANKISFCYKSQTEDVLTDISFSVNDKSRIGLIGNNGCGKTTVLRLISGELEPHSGNISISEAIKIGYVPQEITLDDSRTMSENLWQSRPKFHQINNSLKQADQSSPEYANLISEYYELGIDRFEIEIEKIVAGFNLDSSLLSLELSKLSGGEKTKVALASLLLCGAELMLLDEPTNHLEIKSLSWLEEYLQNCGIPFIAVSHDRRFLDNCVNEIWELYDKDLTVFSGNYSFYKEYKEKERKRLQSEYESQKKKIRQLKEAAQLSRQASASHQAQTGKEGNAPVYESVGNEAKKAMMPAKRLEKRIRMMIEKEEAQKPFVEKERRISLHGNELKNPVVLTVEKLAKRFGDHPVFDDLNMNVKNGVKMGIIGPNGCGKTTLLRILNGLEKASSGSYRWAPRVKIGYYSQEHENLDSSKTILEEVLQGRYAEQTMARIILGRLNIRRDMVHQKIGKLSVGERSKAALAKILFSDFNILIFDEPTNHVELSARDAFEEALENYNGTVLLVSHDRYLLERITTEIFDMERNRLYQGSYGEYLESSGS